MADGPWRPRCGSRLWSGVVLHRILSDPMYAGTAYANRFVLVPSPDPQRRARRPEARTCRRERPREEWVPIRIPAVIDEATHQRAVAQLASNSAKSRRNSRRFYLLRCLLSCGQCGRPMIGVTHPAGGNPRRYYKCCGRDLRCPKYQTRCPRRMLRAEPLEAAVWGHVGGLIASPEVLRCQFDALAAGADDRAGARAEAEKWEAHLRRLDREEVRLVDAYQTEAITLEELKERREQLRERRRSAVAQREAATAARASRAAVDAAWGEWSAFCDRVRSRLAAMDGVERQRLLQLVVDRVIVKDMAVEVRHVIPLNRLAAVEPAAEPDAYGASTGRTAVQRLRSDRVRLPVV